MAVLLMCFMVISTLTVGTFVSAAEKEPINHHMVDFETYETAVYTDMKAAAAAIPCFNSIGNFTGKASLEIGNDSNYGKVFKINKIPDTATLYAGDGCLYLPSLYVDGQKATKSSGKLVLEFDYQLGHGTHWRTGLHITPYPYSGNSVYSSIVLQDNNSGNGISGTKYKISDTNWHHWRIVFDLDKKTYTVDLDSNEAVLSGNVAFPENDAEKNIASYRLGVDMNTSYAAFDNIVTSYIEPYGAEDFEALASIVANDSQTVGKSITITPSFETAGIEHAALYFEDTLISAGLTSGQAVTYTIPQNITPGIYNINLSLTYAGGIQAAKSKTIEVCAKGEAINKHVIDFENYEIAEYTNATSANAALSPITDFNANMFSRTPVSIMESAAGDGHGKILAMNKVTAQINVGNGSFLVPANMEAGSVVGKDSGKIVLEFDLKFLQNWKYGMHITPVSATKQNGSGSYVIMENCQVGPTYISSESEKWLRVKLTYDLDKKVYYGSVGKYPVAETAFTLNSSDSNLAYFKIDNPTTGAPGVERYVHFDNFTTSYIPPIEYTAEELAGIAQIKTSGSQRAGNVVTFTSDIEVTKFESASLYLDNTLISDSVTPGNGVRYFIPSDTQIGDYTLKLKMNYSGIGEVVKEQTFTVYSADEAYDNINVIDFEEYDEAVYTSSADAKAALKCFNEVNSNLFGFADVSIANDEQKGKVYRITKNKNEGNTLYAGNGSTYLPSLYENGSKAYKTNGKLSLEFDFSLSNGTNWASTLMVSPLSKSGYCVFDVKLLVSGGEIPGTGKYINDSNWHHAKIIFDMDNDTYSAWVDDIALPDGEMKFQSAAEHNTYSYRICTQIYDMGWYTSIDNIKTGYIPTDLYKNSKFTKAGQTYPTAGLFDCDADRLIINVNKDYSESVSSAVKVYVNGAEKTVNASYSSKAISIPLAGLDIQPGDEVGVYVSYDATLADNTYANEAIDLSFTAAEANGTLFTVAAGKAKAVFEIDSYVPNGTVCYIATYKDNKLVGLAPTSLEFSPSAAVCETQEVTLPESYDEVKCFVFTSSVKPLIKAIVK